MTVESAVPPPQGSIPRSEGEIVVKDKGGEIRYEVPYDKLVIAVGCYSASLGIEGVSCQTLCCSTLIIGRQIRTLPQRHQGRQSHQNAYAVRHPLLLKQC